MKNIMVYLTLLVFMVSCFGCSGIQVKEDDKASALVLTRIVSRRLGAYMAQKNPDKVAKIVAIVRALDKSDEKDKMNIIGLVSDYLAKQYIADEMLRKDLLDLAKLINLPIVNSDVFIPMDPVNWELFSEAILSYQEGVESVIGEIQVDSKESRWRWFWRTVLFVDFWTDLFSDVEEEEDE